MYKNKQLIVLCLFTLILIQVGVPEVGALAPDTRLRIEPADLVVGLNETFVIEVMVEEANNLAAFQFDLAYDPSILQVTEAALGGFLESTGNSAVGVGPEVNNVEGKLTFGAISYGNGPGPSGAGVLATITCVAHGEGNTALDLREVQILDTAAGAQRVTVEGGRVVVRGTAGPVATTTPMAMSTPEVVDTPAPAATALPSATSTGSSNWTVPALVLVALAIAILVGSILRLKRAG